MWHQERQIWRGSQITRPIVQQKSLNHRRRRLLINIYVHAARTSKIPFNQSNLTMWFTVVHNVRLFDQSQKLEKVVKQSQKDDTTKRPQHSLSTNTMFQKCLQWSWPSSKKKVALTFSILALPSVKLSENHLYWALKMKCRLYSSEKTNWVELYVITDIMNNARAIIFTFNNFLFPSKKA